MNSKKTVLPFEIMIKIIVKINKYMYLFGNWAENVAQSPNAARQLGWIENCEGTTDA